jgi:hypothetical protein
MGPGYWLHLPLSAVLAGGLFWAGSQAAPGLRPVLLVAGAVAAVYAAYVVLMPLVAHGAWKVLEALIEDVKGPADGSRPAPRPRQRRGLPPAPRGGRHWVDDGSSRLVRRRLLVDDHGRVLVEDQHDRRTDLALVAGLGLVVVVALMSGRLGGAAGGVAFALSAMAACALLGIAALRLAGRRTVSRLDGA